MFFAMLFFIWLKSTYNLHVLVINFDDHWVLIKDDVLLKVIGVINLLHSIVMHEEILHFIFQKVYLKLGIMLGLVWKIDNLSQDITLDLFIWNKILSLILLDFSEHFLKAEKIKRHSFKGKFDNFEHNDKEMIDGALLIG